MTEKLIELRQRFRGYAPVKTNDESEDDSDEDIIGISRNNSGRSNLILGVSHRPAGGYRDAGEIENANPNKSYFCKYSLILHPSPSWCMHAMQSLALHFSNNYCFLL
jgi:hypothetical protein